VIDHYRTYQIWQPIQNTEINVKDHFRACPITTVCVMFIKHRYLLFCYFLEVYLPHGNNCLW